MKPFMLMLVLLLLLVSYFDLAIAETKIYPPYVVKAANLCTFPIDLEWPESTFPNENSPFVIGIYGEDPFKNNTLEELLKRKPYNNRPYLIKRFQNIDDVEFPCHILYITTSVAPKSVESKENVSNEDDLLKLLKLLKEKPVLRVIDIEGYDERESHITFILHNTKVRFVINLKEIQKSGIKVRSGILRAALRVIK